jgi:hypothetical protein
MLGKNAICAALPSDAAELYQTLQAICFFILPSPQKGGGVGWGRVQQQRARGNEINTAKRDKIGFAPADLLYSESLTKSTKKEQPSKKFCSWPRIESNRISARECAHAGGPVR